MKILKLVLKKRRSYNYNNKGPFSSFCGRSRACASHETIYYFEKYNYVILSIFLNHYIYIYIYICQFPLTLFVGVSVTTE